MESSVKGKAKRRHLSASECFHLSRSESGSQSITQPLLSSFCVKDPNHGLLPKTSTKRRRTAASEGRSQERRITEFFSPNGVLSSSPQKEQNEATVKEENKPIGYIVYKEEPEEQEMKTDVLEGLTAEMLKKEDEECENGVCLIKIEKEEEDRLAECSTWNAAAPGSSTINPGHPMVSVRKWEDDDEEYPVENLPDSHYGLLGLNNRLVKPQGHFQDLAAEILICIFAQLPASDLYRSISLVCRHWRDIVMDAQFLPWKKLYYRYEQKEDEAVKEVQSILQANCIIQDDDLCVLNMVRYMSQFKHNRRVDLSEVLTCVKGHRLYVQAEACIKHRIPDIETIEGQPNPWSVMALMLILSGDVKDVLDLVNRLKTSRHLLNSGVISEYLWAVATLLLAMRDTSITISNRWHYNIFYVLHLLENAPPRLASGGSRNVQFQVTHEQQQILSHDIQKDHVVKIMAFAGTGKTSTLVKYAQERPHLRFLYVAFNKSVADYAKITFPCNVECRTIHSMAFQAVGYRYQQLKKLGSNLRPFTLAWVLPEGRGGFVNAKMVTQTINTFCASTDKVIGPQHVPEKFRNTHGVEQHTDDKLKNLYVGDAQMIWSKMVGLDRTKQAAYHMTHDGYLKLWQLSKPVLKHYDVIFIDEAQDCSPVIMDIMLSQDCGKILVGDPHQQIYTFRGAVNALNLVSHTNLYYLTQSFRFGSEIAYVGATILDVCKKVKKILVGGYQEGTVRGEDMEVLRALRNAQKQVGQTVAILCRSNFTVFCQAVGLTDINPTCKIYIVGGVKNFGLTKILDVWILMQPLEKQLTEKLYITDPFIRSFNSAKMGGYAGLKKYAVSTEDRELEAKLSVVEKYGARVPQLVKRILALAQDDPQSADYILGTVHKSKGLEFDTVIVTDDFVKVPCSRHIMLRTNIHPGIRTVNSDEWNLLYVAVTRAKRTLFLTKSISNIITLAGEYFLQTGMTSSILGQRQSVVCSMRQCPNWITKESPLSMSKLPFRYIDGAEHDGVLCARCVEQRVGPVAFLLSPPEAVKAMHYTEERLELPINISMLLALL